MYSIRAVEDQRLQERRKMTPEDRSQKQEQSPFRSVPFRSVSEGAETDLGKTNGKGIYNNIFNGTVPLGIRGFGGEGISTLRDARAFADAFHRARRESGDEAAYALFDDGRFPADAICIAMTGDLGSVRRWRQFAHAIPAPELRAELADFHRSLSDDPVRKRGAALNARLARLAKRLGVMA